MVLLLESSRLPPTKESAFVSGFRLARRWKDEIWMVHETYDTLGMDQNDIK